MKALLVLPFLLVPTLAHADQCELVSDDVATRALAAMRGHPNVIEFCAPCGDPAPGAPHAIDHVTKQRGSDGAFAVTLDRREVDLAYLYVQTSPSTYANVAALAGCPTSGVSPSLHVDDASDRGVLITASERPAPDLARPVDPPPPATVTYVIEPRPQPGVWAVIAACALLNGLWALTAVLLLRRRRAIAMRPRAIDIAARSSAHRPPSAEQRSMRGGSSPTLESQQSSSTEQ